MGSRAIVVHKPAECAERLGGISVALLITLLKTHGYDYTNLKPGSMPWGRGRQYWGMTDDQIEAVIRGQTQKHPPAMVERGEGTEGSHSIRGPAVPGWDGVDRLHRRRGKSGA